MEYGEMYVLEEGAGNVSGAEACARIAREIEENISTLGGEWAERVWETVGDFVRSADEIVWNNRLMAERSYDIDFREFGTGAELAAAQREARIRALGPAIVEEDYGEDEYLI